MTIDDDKYNCFDLYGIGTSYILTTSSYACMVVKGHLVVPPTSTINASLCHLKGCG